MGVNILPMTVTRQSRECDLNPGPSTPESRTLTTRLPSHPACKLLHTSSELRFELNYLHLLWVRCDFVYQLVAVVQQILNKSTTGRQQSSTNQRIGDGV